MTDFTLIRKLKLGDESAYETLYKLHYRVLCLYAYKFVEDSTTAENLVSDVIYNMWVKRESIEITSSLRNYLIQSVKNRCYNYLKQENRRREIAEEYYTNQIDPYSSSNEDDTPLSQLLLKELDLKIAKSIDNLPPTTQNIFNLSRFTNLKYAEIAGRTGLSVDSIKYHIKSALSKLREELFNDN